jgi:hypothetical protein
MDDMDDGGGDTTVETDEGEDGTDTEEDEPSDM